MIKITCLCSTQPDFNEHLDALLAFESVQDETVDKVVAEILRDVKTRGDVAVLEYTQRFDKVAVNDLQELSLIREDLEQALNGLPAEQRNALETAAERIRAYHAHQLMHSWHYKENSCRESKGANEHCENLLGQKVTPIDRVGLYVPGGKAAYPSSVLMNAIPAKVAGVQELVMVVPTPGGERNALVLAAAALAGVDRVFTIGGAQAVAALAYGTESIPRVDKIVGPGNAYVAAAKRRVFGIVGIDMVAGPSEILVIADGSTPADWAAMDLFSQAEHDEDAQSILLCPDEAYIEAVSASMEKLIDTMPRQEVIRASLARRGALIKVKDLNEACQIANRIAPEHLELLVDNAEDLLPEIRHAGAIFIGPYASESLGDYCAGPNHVLPTSGSARFSSPLGVYDFQKRSSLIRIAPAAAKELGKVATVLAEGEGLVAHAESARLRI